MNNKSDWAGGGGGGGGIKESGGWGGGRTDAPNRLFMKGVALSLPVGFTPFKVFEI